MNDGRRLERGVDVPVARRHERHALALALDDEADHRALHPARRQPPVDAPPQHRRHLVAVEPVEDPPGLGRVDQPVVDAPRVGDRLLDGGAGDLVEHHPLHRHPGLEVLEEVPGDGLALAILVGGEVQLAGVLEGGPEVLDDVPAAGGELVGGLEAVVDVDGQTLRGQVGDVAHRGAHVEVVAQETGDGLRLGRRFDDDERSGHRALGKSAAITLSRRTRRSTASDQVRRSTGGTVAQGLAALGWDEEWAEQWRALGSPEPIGRVARLDRGWSTVWTADGELTVAHRRHRRGRRRLGGGRRPTTSGWRRSSSGAAPSCARAARGGTTGHVAGANVDVAAPAPLPDRPPVAAPAGARARAGLRERRRARRGADQGRHRQGRRAGARRRPVRGARRPRARRERGHRSGRRRRRRPRRAGPDGGLPRRVRRRASRRW